MTTESLKIKEKIKERYGKIALTGDSLGRCRNWRRMLLRK
jgi:hypothetical protein